MFLRTGHRSSTPTQPLRHITSEPASGAVYTSAETPPWNCKAGKCGSCSAEINGLPRLMCMKRMDELPTESPVVVAPMKTFPIIRDLVTDVSFNYAMARQLPPLRPREPEADGTYRMMQQDVERGQEFRKCIECFMCQDICHVIRDHEDNKPHYAGPRMFIRYMELESHPLDTNDRRELLRQRIGIGLCNITKCCNEVCPEQIKITDNAIIPLKDRVVSSSYDPLAWLGRKISRRERKSAAAEAADAPAAYAPTSEDLGQRGVFPGATTALSAPAVPAAPAPSVPAGATSAD
jgi:succinate dehydrogenase / fumarate reductase iron-sulfur subunit